MLPLGIALEHVHVVGDLAAEILEEGLLVGGGAGLGQLPLEHGRRLDDVHDPLEVVDAGQLDDEPLVALALDDRLGHAELVDAVADRFEGLVDGLVAEIDVHERLDRHGGLVAEERVIPVLEELVEDVLDLSFLVGNRAAQDELSRPGLGDAGEGQALLLQLLLQPGDLLVGFGADGVVGDDLHQEVDAAAQVQAEVDLLADGDGDEDREADHEHREDELPLQSFFHLRALFRISSYSGGGSSEGGRAGGPRSADRAPGASGLRLFGRGRLALEDDADRALRDLDLGVGRDLDLDPVLLHAHDRAVDAAGRDDPAAGLEVLDHLHVLLLLLPLGHDDQEVEDDEDENEGEEGGHEIALGRQPGPSGGSGLGDGQSRGQQYAIHHDDPSFNVSRMLDFRC